MDSVRVRVRVRDRVYFLKKVFFLFWGIVFFVQNQWFSIYYFGFRILCMGFRVNGLGLELRLGLGFRFFVRF